MEEFIIFFKALSDSTRLRVLWLLGRVKTCLCVCEIMDSLNESHYNISRHLKILKYAGLISEKKEGRWVYYSLKDPISPFQASVLEAVFGLSEERFTLESERLKKRLALRKNGRCVVGVNSGQWRTLFNQSGEGSSR